MSKQETGVYQLPNGNWAYRFVALIDGKKISQKRTTDEFGNKFKTQKSAVKAREKALIAARSERLPLLTPPSRRTISEIYNAITGKEFVNELGGAVPHYDFKTENYKIFGGKDGYIQTKEFVLKDIKEYIEQMTK